jgi:hypothetical protein
VISGIPTGNASAALMKFQLATRNQLNDPDVSPNPGSGFPVYAESSVALIDAAGGPIPSCESWCALDQSMTVLVPSLVNIFVSANVRDGPGVLDQIQGTPLPHSRARATPQPARPPVGLVTGYTTLPGQPTRGGLRRRC